MQMTDYWFYPKNNAGLKPKCLCFCLDSSTVNFFRCFFVFLANVPQPPAFNAHAGSSRSREKKPCTDMQHFTLVKCFGNQPKSTDFVADKGGLWWPLCNTLR